MNSCSYCGKENADSSIACVGCGSSLENSQSSPRLPSLDQWLTVFAWIGLLAGVAGTSFVLFITIPFFFIERDISPPIVWTHLVFRTAVATFLVGMPCAIVAIAKGRRLIGWLSAFLALQPVPFGFALVYLALTLNGIRVV